MSAVVPFGAYVLLGRVNVGGMAEVFLAKTFGAKGFERFVAIKRLLPSVMGNKEFVDMFIDEAKIAVQLTHANIAQIYELGDLDGQLYIAMEFVHGKELKALAQRSKKVGQPLEHRLAAHVVAKAAEGLDHAHQKKDSSGRLLGIVHRDISPQNILVSFDGEVKLIDFGIAKAKDRISQTQVGVLKGKIGYMSPEQIMGVQLDQRSDLFSLGCVLYELVTGERAFSAESEFTTFEKVRDAVYTPPSVHGVEVDPALDKIMRKILAKDREQRYRRGAEVNADLQRYLLNSGEPYTNEHVAEVMQTLFKSEYGAEMEKLREYQSMRPLEEIIPLKKRQEAESHLDDRTTVVALPTANTEDDTNDYSIVEDDDDNGRRGNDPALMSTQEDMPMPKELRQALDREAAAPASKPSNTRRPSPSLTTSQELDHELSSALRDESAPTRVLALTTKKSEDSKKSSNSDIRRASRWESAEFKDTGAVRQGPTSFGPASTSTSTSSARMIKTQDELPQTMETIDFDERDGFSRGEILLIAGAGVFALLFVLSVYLFTSR